MLSTRGAQASAGAAKETEVWDVLSDLHHPTANPAGFISLGVAENSLMHTTLRDFLHSKPLVDSSAVSLTYGSGPTGSKSVRKALSTFVNAYFKPYAAVHASQIMATNGVSTAIEHCSWVFANSGDGILLGRPYYRAFIPDIGLRPGVKVVGVAFGGADPLGQECVKRYEKAILAEKEKGVKVRALMLCNPHNPLGRCYSKETVIDLMKLCQKYELHFISDEIYALSVWKNTVDKLDTLPTPFTSALSIDTAGIIDPALVHVLWGFSKDFGANGIRLGAIISQNNPDFLRACHTCAIYSSPSSLAENAAVAILSDENFLASYVQMNQERLSSAYAYAVNLLRRYDIEYRPGANSAFFLFVNLGKKYLENRREDTVVDPSKGEVESTVTQFIYDRLMMKKIFLVLGDAVGAEEPGWFRLVFSQDKELVEEGIRRVAEALEE
ncbi:PLP-dependent transferase [Byssothecium circinans]|uniref:PLP-dependent transferase n=1 Tax=Byssothecium circinans TaxID=147558 RepID=A0A6A5TRI4_9PLEO|nr:PLP-dependent transferase [Byssothecium circinans]